MQTLQSGLTVLVVAELRDDVPSGVTRELLGLARSLAQQIGGSVGAAIARDRSRAVEALIAHGADVVYACRGADADEDDAERWLRTIERIAHDAQPTAVFCGHTTLGAELGPRLAFRLESGVATGCVNVTLDEGRLLFTRACYGGNARETISFTTVPAVATIKAAVGTAALDTSRTGTIIRIAAPAAKCRARIISRQRETSASLRLEDARVIVAGGRGLEGPEGFRALEDLAAVLGAAVGASRVPCDLGWCPHSWQIGLTGKTVTPELYFAVGISGAGHHMAGCGNAKTIVAINSDPEAAIFKEARFGIVGDYRKIVPALTSALSGLNVSAGPHSS
jgi:electron transfer flavoprotein alpha subunit